MICRQDAEAHPTTSRAGELPAQAEEIRLLAFLLHKAIIRDLDRRLEASGAGISGPQYGVIRLLSEENATISELSGRMLLAPATLVPIVDTLERKGLLQRSTDPNDRRRNPLLLTEKGAGIVAAVPLLADGDSVTQGLISMGQEKVAQLHGLLYELVACVSQGESLLERVLADSASERGHSQV